MDQSLVSPDAAAGLFLLGSLFLLSGAPAHAAAAVLSLPPPAVTVPAEGAIKARRSVRAFATGPMRLADVSQLLWAAQGVTGAEGKRAAPSAGALYPLEIFLVAARVDGLEPGAYRYRPRSHELERVSDGDRLGAIVRATHGQEWIEEAPAVVIVAAVADRTRAKYGARSDRYVAIEAGAAAENAALEAAALGLGSCFVGAFDDQALLRAVGVTGPEKPLLVLPVGRPR